MTTTSTLVTGANRGIGLELTAQLQAKQHTLTAVCRNSSAALDALGVRVLSGVDIGQNGAEQRLAEVAKGQTYDWVIANAGILNHESLEHLDFASIQSQFAVNSLGPLRTVFALLPYIREGGKVALITSRMGSIADNTSGAYYGYRMSKAALNAAGVSLALDLEPRRIAVALLHPGYVRTDMTGNQGGISPREAAAQLIERIEALKLETSGTFWHANGEVLPW
jgi:NAD(P)-dependent dehydrogenase (short-subunit alcohol dehydrogenase family)